MRAWRRRTQPTTWKPAKPYPKAEARELAARIVVLEEREVRGGLPCPKADRLYGKLLDLVGTGTVADRYMERARERWDRAT
jgi:hypothetical protein